MADVKSRRMLLRCGQLTILIPGETSTIRTEEQYTNSTAPTLSHLDAGTILTFPMHVRVPGHLCPTPPLVSPPIQCVNSISPRRQGKLHAGFLPCRTDADPAIQA